MAEDRRLMAARRTAEAVVAAAAMRLGHPRIASPSPPLLRSPSRCAESAAEQQIHFGRTVTHFVAS
jgi:hypothetical protein